MPLYVRFAILGTCFVFLLCSLVIEIRVIAEIYRENEQYGGKKSQCDGEPNQLLGKIKHFLGLGFGSNIKNAEQRSETGNRSRNSQFRPICVQRLLMNIRKQCRNRFS